MAKASDNPFPSLLLVEQAAVPATPAAGQARLYRGTDNKLYIVDDTGAATEVGAAAPGGGSGQGLKDFARAKRTSGNVALNSTTFTNVDTALDLVMTAAAGDVVEAKLMCRGSKDASGSTYLVFDFHTIVAGAPVNSVTADGAAGTGLANSFPAWASGTVGQNTAPTFFNGSKRYTLQAGDISSGTVTLRLRGFCGAACTINANDPMLYVEATNLGPQL